MKKLLFAGLMSALLFGCASGSFQVPKQEYQKRVQVLGVLPLLVDYASATKYPQKEALYDILARSAQGKHEFLVDRLKKKKGYFDVRSLTANPELTALSLLSSGSAHDAAGRPLGYAFDTATVTELTRRNVVDALLIVVLSGEQVEETRRSRTMLETLKTSYSNVYATAAVIDRNGEVLWRMAGEDGFPALMLQYPDFDEAFYNKTDLVQVKNITLAGIDRALEENIAADGTTELPAPYKDLFGKIASGISPGLLDSLR